MSIDHLRNCSSCPGFSDTFAKGRGASGGIVIVTDTHTKMGLHKLLKETLAACGVDSKDPVYVTAAVPCRYESKTRAVPAAAWKACRNGVLTEIIQARPKKILLCGSAATSQFFGKATAIKNVRGKAVSLQLPTGSLIAMPTWSPATVMANPYLFRDFAYDINKLLTVDSVYPEPKMDTFVANDYNDVLSLLNTIQYASRISSDLETTSKRIWEADIMSFGFGALYADADENHVGSSIIVPEWVYEDPKVRSLCAEFMEDFEGEISFHNAGYDMSVLARIYGRELRIRNIMDTMLLASALDERGSVDEETSESSKKSLSQGVSLKTLARVRYDAPDYEIDFDEFHAWRSETLAKGDVAAYRKRLSEELFPYHSKDLAYTALLREDLGREIEAENPRLMNLVREVTLPAALAFGMGELIGVDVNREKFEAASAALSADIDKSLEALQPFGKLAGLDEFNPNSSAHVAKVIYGYFRCKPPKSNQQSWGATANPTDKIAIAALQVDAMAEAESDDLLLVEFAKDKLAFFELLLECKQKSKAKSTYIDKALEYSAHDGKLHPSLSVTSTDTGRTSARGYGFQTIPAGEDGGSRSTSGVAKLGQAIRDAFEAPDGYVYVEADYSQAQMRIAAWLSNDKDMLAAYREGKDLYKIAGGTVYRKAPDSISELERQAAKVVFLGILFGRGAESLVSGFEMDLLVREGFKRWTVPQAEAFTSNLLSGFAGLRKWREDQLTFAMENNYVETVTGRRRRFPLIADRRAVSELARLSVNSPIQGTEFDMIALAIARLRKMLTKELGDLLFCIHDSLFLRVRIERLMEVARILKECMEPRTMRDCIPDYPNDTDLLPIAFPVGIKAGKTWGSMVKVELV